MRTLRGAFVCALLICAASGTALAAGPFGAWDTAQKIDEIAGNHPDLNTPSQDGCPIQSPDGLSLYIASNRPGRHGGLDIWMASRPSEDDPWGAPVDLPEPINSASDDFCPTPVHKNGLFFVSRRVIDGVTCGLGDIYFTHGRRRSGASRNTSPVRRKGRTACSTSRARPTFRDACTSRAARRRCPVTSSSANRPET